MSLLTTTPGRVLILTSPCVLHAITPIADSICSFLAQQGFNDEFLNVCRLIVSEAGSNAVKYARPDATELPVEFVVEVTPSMVELRVRDHTAGFELPAEIGLPGILAECGRGLYLMKVSSDYLDYQRGRESNTLVIRKRRPDLVQQPAIDSSSVEVEVLEATLQTMTEELAASYESLSAIFRFTEDLARSGVNAAFVERWFTILKAITGADWFVLRLADAETRRLLTYQTLPPHLSLEALPLVAAPGETTSVELRAALHRHDVWFDPRQSGPQNEHRQPLDAGDPLRRLGPELSGFSHPMHVSGELMGVLTVGFYNASQTFTAGQVNIVQTLADFLAIQFRDAQYDQARLQAHLLERDYEVASRIQRRLLPKYHPSLGSWVTRGFCQSAQRVGGDFYDILPVGSSAILLAVADVMGKGLPAAIFANVFRTLLRSRPDLASQPGAFLEWLNRNLATDLDELEMFITAQLAFADFETGELRVAGAGHPPLLLCGAGVASAQVLSAGPPLGILTGVSYEESRTTLPRRARVLMYTDGITEVFDESGAQVGTGPLLELLDRSVVENLSAEELTAQFAELRRRIGGNQPAADDQTFVLLMDTHP